MDIGILTTPNAIHIHYLYISNKAHNTYDMDGWMSPMDTDAGRADMMTLSISRFVDNHLAPKY